IAKRDPPHLQPSHRFASRAGLAVTSPPTPEATCQAEAMSATLLYVDAVTVRVPDLDSGLAFYGGVLGHQLIWRDDSVGAAGLECPDSTTEVVLTTEHPYEPNWKVSSADAVA